MIKVDLRPFLAFAFLGTIGVQACPAQTAEPDQVEPAQAVTAPAQTPPHTLQSTNPTQIIPTLPARLDPGQTAPTQQVPGIGSASTISNRVEGFFGGGPRALAVGSEVFQNELVRTALASDAKLIFLDNTNLSVGPASEVTLDRFVYDADKNAGAVVVRTTKGIFRFVTGSQRPQNYLISTPIASIGVRGTIFDLLVVPDRVTVLLIEGQIQVTTLLNRTIALTQPGTSVTVYANGRVEGPSVWRRPVYVDFASTNFPYFPPVTNIKQKAVVPPPIKRAKVEPKEPPPRKRNPPAAKQQPQQPQQAESRPVIRVTGPMIRFGGHRPGGGDMRPSYPKSYPKGGYTPPSRSRPN